LCLQGSDSELIFYEREEITGPKLSDFHRCKVPDDIKEFLSTTLGTWGIVKKVRNLIMIGQTRVHFDSVEGLGDFVELEVSTVLCKIYIKILILIVTVFF
jgi:adenylate cyclase class IV